MQLPAVGTVLEGRYRLDAVLGEGGFAVVYRATDVGAGRSVAVKVLRPDAGHYDPQREARFLREVKLVARLRDPHTAQLFDHGRTGDGLLFMVFELIAGMDLADYIHATGTMPAEAVRHVLTQVLHALREAHHVGLVHRDIKPENIRVYEFGGDPLRVKLLDFGVAKPTDLTGDAKLTQTGALVGTPRYMSPEQLRAERVGPPSDIYSLGVVAFEMLMGEPAMHGHDIGDQLRRMVDSQALYLPDSHEARLRHVVHRMVARDVRERYQSAEEVLQELELGPAARPPPPASILAPLRGTPPPAPTLSAAPGRSHIAVGALVVVTLVGVGIAAFLALRAAPEQPSAPSVGARRLSPLLAGAEVPVGSPSEQAAAEPAAPPPPAVDAGSAAPEDPTRSPGCGKLPPFLGRRYGKSVDGRELSISIPVGYDPDVPHAVVLMFHDQHQTHKAVVKDSGMEEVGERNGFIVLAPRDEELMDWWAGEDDVYAGPAAIRAVESTFCIDRTRVYAVGHGRGAYVVERLPCHMPELRGIATTAYRSEEELRCTTHRPVPYIHITGRDDRHLPRAGGEGCTGPTISLARHDELWRARNQCADSAKAWLREGKSRCQQWACAAPYVSCELDGGRGFDTQRSDRTHDIHSCDGGRPKISVAETIWRFFAEVTPDAAEP